MNTRPTSLRHSLKLHAIALALLGTGLAAHAQSQCTNDIYLSQSDGGSGHPTVLEKSAGALPVGFSTMGTSANRTYNALGYNPSDDELYGITLGRFVVKINKTNGATTDVNGTTAITGTGITSNDSFNSGAFNDAGDYYVKPYGNNARLYKVNLADSTATLITLSQSFQTSDMAWVNGLMYSTADNGQLYSIDVTTGATTAIGGPDNTGGVLGAQFSGTNGLFGSANNGSGMYRINLTTGRRDKISDSPASGNNDGASCPTVALFEPLPEDPNLPVNPVEPTPAPTAVPALDEVGLGLLGLLSAGLGAFALRRRRANGQ